MRVRKWVQACLLLFLGLYFVDNMLTGRIAFYVNASFSWLSWFGGAVFLMLGIFSVVNLLGEQSKVAYAGDAHEHNHDDHGHDHHDHEDHDHHDHDHEDHDDHDHDHEEEDAHEGHNHGAVASWPILAIAAIPLALGVFVPAKPLGATAIGTSGVTTAIGSAASGTTTQLAVAPTDRNVLDWVRTFSASNNVDEFSGQPADLIGFVYRDVRFKDKPQDFMVARFVLSCCVADASAIGVFVESPKAGQYAQDSWLHLKGKFTIKDVDGQKTAVLIPDSVDKIDQPDHPYLYP